MTATTRKKIRAALALLSRVTIHGDGTATARDSFFYRLQGSPEKLATLVTQELTAAGLAVVILETREDWAAWPKTSYFVCRFRLIEGTS